MSIAVSGGRTVWGLDPLYTSGGGLQLLERNGTATTNTTLPYTDKLTVRARGGQYCQGWPHMTLAVDGRQVLSQTVSQLGWKSYAVPVNLTAGNHSLVVNYDNDFQSSACNRNLRVDYLDATDPPPPAPAPAHSRPRFGRSRDQPVERAGGAEGNHRPPGTLTRASSQLQLGDGDLRHAGQPGYSSPVFFASAGDPTTANVSLTTDWSPTKI